MAEGEQKLDEQLNAGLTLLPQFVKRFVIGGVVQRGISYLMAWNYLTGEPVKLTSTPSGVLRVTSSGGGKAVNDTKSGNAPDAYGAALTFDSTAVSVDIFIWNNTAMIQRSSDGVLYNDEFEVAANTVFSFDADTKAVKIKNKVALSVARYSIIGWW